MRSPASPIVSADATQPGIRSALLALLALIAALVMIVGPARAAHADELDTITAQANAARAAAGLAPLIRDAGMDQVAANWANQLAAAGTLSHNPDYATQIPAGWNAAAENVANGYADGAATHAGWMASDGHRANILGDYTHLGVAFVVANGTTWAVEVFGRYPNGIASAASAPVAVPVTPAPTAAAAPVVPAPSTAPAAASPAPTPSPSVAPTPSASVSTAPSPSPSSSDGVATRQDNQPDPESIRAVQSSGASEEVAWMPAIAVALVLVAAALIAVPILARRRARRV